MANIKLPLFFQPNQVVFLDDNINFLSTLTLLLPNEFHFKIFTVPQVCLQYLKDHFLKLENEPKKNFFVYKNEDGTSIELQFNEIHKQIHNSDRFKYTTVCVTDYTMPIMNGIEFCEKISNLKCRKILLTGDAGYDLAVIAFNSGIIDKFIMKDTINYTQQIIDSIEEQRLNYYIELTENLLGSHFEEDPNQLAFLHSSELKNYFEQACKTKGIVEYYLLDAHGSYLLLNMQGKPTWFLMKDEREMKKLQSVAEFDKAPLEILEKLKNRTHVPFFFSEKDFETPVAEWKPFLHPVIKIIKSNNTLFYISIIHEENSSYQFSEPVFSYQKYLQTFSV